MTVYVWQWRRRRCQKVRRWRLWQARENPHTEQVVGCFNCVKRRIICDWTEPKCKKCAKKGLDCPGYGIRYRFAKQQSPTAADTQRLLDSTRAVAKQTRITFLNNDQTGLTDQEDGIVEDQDSHTEPEARDHREDVCELSIDSAGRDIDYVQSSLQDYNWNFATSDVQMGLLFAPPPPPMETIDAQTRMLFSYFSTRVSPVMVMFDGKGNGYRHSILPLASSDDMVRRAVSVTSALHLAARMPELRIPAERGRAAIISKLRTDVASGNPELLSTVTWATILLLIVGDLVTGHEDVLILHQMLKAFMHARCSATPRDPLEKFLLYQSQLFGLFASIMQGESEGVRSFGDNPNAVLTLESLNPHSEAGGGETRIRLYNEAFRRAAQIYLHRSRSYLNPGNDFQAMEMLNDFQQLLIDLDPTTQGAHTLVWPYFIAAAESSTETHRQYFVEKLRHIESATGYRNVSVAIQKLPDLWKRQRTERWTISLPRLMTVVM